jgi:phage/plasmid-like protein (TIGR03299 family)
MGLLAGLSPIPESYAGPRAWWPLDAAVHAITLEGDLRGEEMLAAAHIDWSVEKRPVFFPTGVPLEAVRIPGFVAVVRQSDDACLGLVSPSYHVFQNREMVQVTDAVLDEGGAHYHTAGSLYGGQLVWTLAKFDKTIHVKGDGSPIEDYLLALTGHDGRHQLTFVNTNLRVWCGNTASAALRGASNRIGLRHTPGMGARIGEIRSALDLHFRYADTLESFLNDLADRRMTLEEVRSFTEALIPQSPDVERSLRTEQKRHLLVDVFEHSPNLQDLPLTGYRAYQATVEWADHALPYGDSRRFAGADRRAAAIIEGGADELKSRAAALLSQA